MTLKIEITIPQEHIDGDHSSIYMQRAMRALGYVQSAVQSAPVVYPVQTGVPLTPSADAETHVEEAAAELPLIRLYGQPTDGRARRTKAEITLDEEAKDLLEDVGVSVDSFNKALVTAGGDWNLVMADLHKIAAEKHTAPQQSNISTGEERLDPAAEQTQDASEEEAGEDDVVLTHDHVREALGDYAAAFGMPAAQANGPVLMGAAKISLIPDNQGALRKAVDAIRDRITKGVA